MGEKVFRVSLGSACPWCGNMITVLVISELCYVKCLNCNRAGKKFDRMQDAATSFFMAHFYNSDDQG